MIRRVLTAALLAGLIAGLAVSAVQRLAIVPLIFQAEALEAPAADGHGHDHDQGAGPWAPADGLERTAWTVAANVLTGVAFALILAAGIVLRGGAVDGRRGLAWGLAGFACFALLPGLGLPLAPPGMAEGVLADRQVWWLATASASAGGLALIVFGRALGWRLAGVALLVGPHAVGVPLPDGTEDDAYLAALDAIDEIGIADRPRRHGRLATREQVEERQDQEKQDDPESDVARVAQGELLQTENSGPARRAPCSWH